MQPRVTSPDALVGMAQTRLGTSRRTAGCPWTRFPGVDDCSYFASWVVFGANTAGQGPIGWVDNWKTAPGGTYHPGKAGMQRGDVVLFDWDGNDVGNHVEIATIAPNPANGRFQTIGANGSDTINVGYRNRNAYVLGYWRPAYSSKPATPSPASTGSATSLPSDTAAAIIHSIQEDDMRSFHITDGKGNQEYAVYVPGRGLVAPTSAAFIAVVNKAFGTKTVEINTNDSYALSQLAKGAGK